MKNDWIVWVGCACLLGVGAIWGQVVPDLKFFEVDNVHDLAEIVAAVATSFAVCLALYGLNAWKDQAVATSDHELARRVAVMLQRYRFVMPSCIDLASYVAAHMRHNVEATTGLITEVRDQMNAMQELHSQLRALELECRAVWGATNASLFDPLFSLDEKCQGCLRLYLQWSRPDQTEKIKQSCESVVSQMDREFRRLEGFDDRAERTARFESKLAPLDEMLRVKLLR